jgi:SAM-dependent methyltransferase
VPEPHKQADIASRTEEFMEREASKPFGWESYHWVKWATITEAMRRLEVDQGAKVLDVGCGSGWTSLFLAESGYRVTGMDLVAANVELCRDRARRWGLEIPFQEADAEELDLGTDFDAALVYDALHHSTRQDAVVQRVAAHPQYRRLGAVRGALLAARRLARRQADDAGARLARAGRALARAQAKLPERRARLVPALLPGDAALRAACLGVRLAAHATGRRKRPGGSSGTGLARGPQGLRSETLGCTLQENERRGLSGSSFRGHV